MRKGVKTLIRFPITFPGFPFSASFFIFDGRTRKQCPWLAWAIHQIWFQVCPYSVFVYIFIHNKWCATRITKSSHE